MFSGAGASLQLALLVNDARLLSRPVGTSVAVRGTWHPGRMLDLFDVLWPRVELHHVFAFLGDAGDEGVTWEAKADDEKGRLHPDSLAKAACGLSNQVGGYVIVGAKQETKGGPWTVPGIMPPKEEPTLWIGKVLRGLNPQPRFDLKAWTLDEGRLVAVVRIDPVDQTPCMTRRGRVYERVSGETLPVEDPMLLERLFRRGQHARERSEAFADLAAERALDAVRWQSERSVGIAIGLAPIGRESDDISSRLFVRSFRHAIFQSVQAFTGQEAFDAVETWQQQDSLTCFAHFDARLVLLANGGARRQHRTTWLVQATWDGAVAASATFSPEAVTELAAVDQVIVPGWREAASLVERLGGYGPAHLTVGVHASQPLKVQVPRELMKAPPPPPPPAGTLYAQLPVSTRMGRVVSVAEPSSDVQASLHRELQRAAGIEAFEPEHGPLGPV